MKAIECLLYSQDKFKTVSDAWSHTIFVLSYPVYYPEGYKPKSLNIAKNWADEIEELFEDFKRHGLIFKNEKGNWEFKKINIKEIISEVV